MSTAADRRQGLNSSLAFKAPCRLATTANITLSGYQTIDGVLPVSTDTHPMRRILVKDQTASADNGIYVMSSGVWERDKDWDGNTDFVQGTRLYVHSGSTSFGAYVLTSTVDAAFMLGTNAITFTAAAGVDINFGAYTTLTTPDPAADFVTIFDTSAGVTKKVLPASLFKYHGDGTAALPAIAFESDLTKGIYSAGSNLLGFAIAGAGEMVLSATALYPFTSDGNALGSATNMWADLFLASGAVINVNGDWLATHTAGILTVGTGDLRVTTAGTNAASVVTLDGTQTLGNKTLTAAKIANAGFLADANANELIIFTTTASAVNEWTLANGGTGVNPKLTASGETNVGLDFQAKGTGTYRLLGTASQAAELRLYEDTDDGTNYTALKVGTQSADVTYTLPTAYPAVTGYMLSSTDAGVMSWAAGGAGAVFGHNTIINGAFAMAQRGTSFTSTGSANNDDTYNLDRWTLLSNGNNIVDVSRDTADVPTGGLYAAKMSVVTVNKKFGLLQIIEQKNCIGLIGNTITLSFSAKVSNTTRLATCKAVILSWSSTADTVTSDVVSAWNADSATPTWAANWTAENTPADLNLTTGWASYSITALIDTASTTNISVFIWSDNETDTDVADTMNITDVQLEIGATATTFERRPASTELALCQRYYQKSWVQATAPGTTWSQGNDQLKFSHPSASFASTWTLPVVTRTATPVLTIYDAAGTSAKVTYFTSVWNDAGAITTQACNGAWAFVQHVIASSVFTNFAYTIADEL